MFGIRLPVSYDGLSAAQKQNVRILLMAVGAILVAALSNVSVSRISFLELPLPTFCTFKLFTGLDCPGCGLTRAVVFALNGQFYQSYLLHLWGIPLAALILIQIPYRMFRLLSERGLFFTFPAAVGQWQGHVLLLSLLVPWLLKTSFVLFIRFH